MNSLLFHTGYNRMPTRKDNDILVKNYKRIKNTYF